jgi:penicillin-binding protein 1C
VLREQPSAEGFRGRVSSREDIGVRLVQATLTSEDSEFFEHDGVDRRAIARAVGQNVRHRRLVSGASTITQQLVKLLDGHAKPRARGLAIKLREAARAQNLEHELEKHEILIEYFNRLPYGHGLMGPAAAAQAYFGVAARELSWAQATVLAVLPRAPSYLDPYRHLDRVLLRQRALIEALHSEGHLDVPQRDRALAEEIVLRPLSHPFHAPHMVESLRARGQLVRGGETRTTLDLDLQRDTEGLVRTAVAELVSAGVSDAALVVVDNDTGEVLAYVGSADFHDPAIAGQVDMVRALRQPGSTLKPFVYAASFARGRGAADMLADVPTRFTEAHGTTYTPVNYSRTFEGPISAREALAGSLNVPAVRLAAEMEHGELLTLLHQLGFLSLDRDASHYGLALALGSGEVQLLELAAAYVALARGGEVIPLRLTLEDGGGDHDALVDAAARAGERVFAPAIAAQVSEVLSDPLARIRGLHGRGPFRLPYPMAVKTGTSSGHRDTWSVGYTRERTVAVWVGNADGSATVRLTGSTGAGPLMAAAMRRAMDDVVGRRPLWDSALLVSAELCPLSGKRAGPACDERVRRLVIAAHTLDESCALHRHVTRVRHSERALWRCDPQGESRAVVFPAEFDEWLLIHAPGGEGPDAHGTPWLARERTVGCDDAPGLAIPILKIAAPASGSVFNLGERGGADDQVIDVRARFEGALSPGAGEARVGEVEFVLDGRAVARSRWPYRAQVGLTPGDHELVVRPVDPALPVMSEAMRFSVR